MKTDQQKQSKPVEARCLARGTLTTGQRQVYDQIFRDCRAGGMTGDLSHECAMDMATRVNALQEFIATLCFTPTTKEAYTNKPAMILDAEHYIVPGDDGTGFLLCAGKPDGDDSETEDSYETLEKLAIWAEENL